ncbi:hypothetical protein FISHEDRAFT_55902 [Fistulina hepatica ATCC 64428]|uniref:Uncharacterized protein n=1 Tax=Fistulina hepatica ATCC 64428 TaxID=1128425 RepID=A0A0D7AM61_9AGAR|nr:hypothetical protein FISHEDRAFT_55902 [Fistulina hepatica ATCC 64428]
MSSSGSASAFSSCNPSVSDREQVATESRHSNVPVAEAKRVPLKNGNHLRRVNYFTPSRKFAASSDADNAPFEVIPQPPSFAFANLLDDVEGIVFDRLKAVRTILFPPLSDARRTPVVLVQSSDRVARNMFFSQCSVVCHSLDEVTVHEGNAAMKSVEHRTHCIDVDIDAVDPTQEMDGVKGDISLAICEAARRCKPRTCPSNNGGLDSIEQLASMLKENDRVLLIVRNLETTLRKLSVPFPQRADDASLRKCIDRLEDALLSLLSTLVEKNIVRAFVFHCSLPIFSRRIVSMIGRLGDVIHIQPTDDILNTTLPEMEALLLHITSSVVPEVRPVDHLPSILTAFAGNSRVSTTGVATNHAATLRTDVCEWFCVAVASKPELLSEERCIQSTFVDLATNSLSELLEDGILQSLIMCLSDETWRKIRSAVHLDEGGESQRVPTDDGQSTALILTLYDLRSASEITDQALSEVAMRTFKQPAVRGRSIDMAWLTRALRSYLCDDCTLKMAACLSQNGHVAVQALLAQIAWTEGVRCDILSNVAMTTSARTLYCPIVAPTSNRKGECITRIFNVIDLRLVGLRWGTARIYDTWPSEGMKEFRQRVKGCAENKRSDTYHFMNAVDEGKVDQEVLVAVPGGSMLETYNAIVTGSADALIEAVKLRKEDTKKANKNRGRKKGGQNNVKYSFHVMEPSWASKIPHL